MKRKTSPKADGQTRYTLRLPAAVLKTYRDRAKNSDRSLAGEIVSTLRRAAVQPAAQ